jgi:2-methylcitrate dehydratase PrpD
LLAVGEGLDSRGQDLLTAFVVGLETECRLGESMSPGHYDGGFHSTATLGTFGAAAGCAHLLDLDAGQWQNTFGIAAATAAGLKSAFGTMCKPFHAGNAASNGVLAGRLAQQGFTGAQDVLERSQGFGSTHSATFDQVSGMRPYGDPWFVRQVLFKYHAACFLTHSTIEGLLRLKEHHYLRAADVAEVVLRVAPGHLDVCNIQEPRTGLEAKFSLRFTAALSLVTGQTGEDAFTDGAVSQAGLVQMRVSPPMRPPFSCGRSTGASWSRRSTWDVRPRTEISRFRSTG